VSGTTTTRQVHYIPAPPVSASSRREMRSPKEKTVPTATVALRREVERIVEGLAKDREEQIAVDDATQQQLEALRAEQTQLRRDLDTLAAFLKEKVMELKEDLREQQQELRSSANRQDLVLAGLEGDVKRLRADVRAEAEQRQESALEVRRAAVTQAESTAMAAVQDTRLEFETKIVECRRELKMTEERQARSLEDRMRVHDALEESFRKAVNKLQGALSAQQAVLSQIESEYGSDLREVRTRMKSLEQSQEDSAAGVADSQRRVGLTEENYRRVETKLVDWKEEVESAVSSLQNYVDGNTRTLHRRVEDFSELLKSVLQHFRQTG